MTFAELGLSESLLRSVAEQGYEPKEVDVNSQVLAMKNANPDAVICSASSGWTTTRSSSGLMATLVSVVTI